MPRLECHGGQVETKGTLSYSSLIQYGQYQLRHTSGLVVDMSLKVCTCITVNLGDYSGSAG